MPVLFASSEDIDFVRIGAPVVSTSSGRYEAGYSRGALSALKDEGWIAVLPAPVTTAWAQARIEWGYLSALGAGLIAFHDSLTGSPVARVALYQTGLRLDVWSGSAWTTVQDTGFMPPSSNTRYRITAMLVMADAGEFKLWFGDTLVGHYTGDTKRSSATSFDQIHYLSSANNAATLYINYFTECLVANEDPRLWRVVTLAPDGAGHHTGWSGSYADVDEVQASSGDLISSGAGGETMSMTVTDLPSGYAGWYPMAIQVTASVKAGASGPTGVQVGVRSGAVDDHAPAVIPGAAEFESARGLWHQDPATVADWDLGAVAGLEVGVRSVT